MISSEYIDRYLSPMLNIIAIICLLLAIGYLLRQNIKVFAAFGSLFVVCFVFAHFPWLDSINAFSIQVKMRANLDRSEEILNQIRMTSMAMAKYAYINIAWNGRAGGMSEQEKQKLLDMIDEQLKYAGVSDLERKNIAKPFIGFIKFDLYQIYTSVIYEMLTQYRKSEKGSDCSKSLELFENKLQLNSLEQFQKHLISGEIFASFLKELIPKSLYTASEYSKLHDFADTIGRIFDACLNHGGYTEEAFEFLQSFSRDAGTLRPGYHYRAFVEWNAKPGR